MDNHILPDIEDLRSRVRFSPTMGRIWLGNWRMILLHASAFGLFRYELIEELGINKARRLLTRMGYAAGAQDAELIRKVRSEAGHFDVFLGGPQLHALEGIVQVKPLNLKMDLEKREYYGEFLWIGSVEGEAHLQQFGPQPYPACWMQVGYACGYTTAFMGFPVLYREVDCCASGSEHCMIVGKPLDEWDDCGEDLRYIDFGRLGLERNVNSAVVLRESKNHRSLDSRVERIEYRDPLSDKKMGVIVGTSAAFVESLHKLKKVAPTKATVLLAGESGVGKECFARLLHSLSPRQRGPFIAVNCAAVPTELFEAELFGVHKGAFTGAVESRAGRFERANTGTLFLDEVASVPIACQPKLLRILEEGYVERLGEPERHRVDVRIVAATSRDLRSEAEAGRFRTDLFYRLNVFPVVIQPLRYRRDDIPILLDYFVRYYEVIYDKKIIGLTEAAMDLLLSYDYLGNVRELEKMIERAVILADGDAPLDTHHFLQDNVDLRNLAIRIAKSGMLGSSELTQASTEHASEIPLEADFDSIIDAWVSKGTDANIIEVALLKSAVQQSSGNLTKAARQLSLTRAQLAYRLEKYGLKQKAGTLRADVVPSFDPNTCQANGGVGASHLIIETPYLLEDIFDP